MTGLPFILAVLVLLSTPGPTNTLIALGGYGRGWRGALPLVAGELAGYLCTIIPVTIAAGPLFLAYPQAATFIKISAVAWILYLSVRLWISAKEASEQGKAITIGRVFITTLLNPKALIIALVIMPKGDALALLPWLLMFSCLVVIVANGWILFGRMMHQTRALRIGPALIQRVGAAGLLTFAMIVAGSSVRVLA